MPKRAESSLDRLGLVRLLREQDGVVSRGQLADLGASRADVRRLLARRELVVVHPGVYVDHGGTTGRTIHLVVDRDRRISPPEGVTVERVADHDLRQDTASGVVHRDVRHRPERVLVELDGAFGHRDSVDRWADLQRDLDAALDDHVTLRPGWAQVLEPCRLVSLVGDVLRRRGWSGRPHFCGPECTVADSGVPGPTQRPGAPSSVRPKPGGRLSGPGARVAPVTEPTLDERRIDALCNAYVDDFCALDPLTATSIGVAGHEHEMTDYSPAGFDARDALNRAVVAAVEATTPVDDREAAAKDAFLERTCLEIELEDAGVQRSRMSVLWSPLHEIRGVFDLMPTEGEEAVAAIAARLAAVPAALEGLRVTLTDEARKGNVVAARQYAEVAEQVRRWTGQAGDAGDFYLGLVDRLEVEDDSELRALAGAASAATAAFGLFLSDELEPQGKEREGVGREVYGLASRYFLGAEVDLDETYAWGWAELQRLSDLMHRTADRILPGADVDAAVAHLDADPERVVHGREAFRDWMQELADRTVAAMADVHFDIPAPIRRIECKLAPTNDGGIYYTGPSEDFERPGRMWWSVPDGIDDFHPWREVTTVYHEGVPGHHLQVAQTAYRRDTLNRWQRLMCWCSGHGEGWALYAERLMEELGFLEDPADLLGMLDGQSLRAARVIVDIGMHLELEIPEHNRLGAGGTAFHPGETWTPELGLEFMRLHCRMDDEFIQFEVKRYLGLPGQAPSYKVGERIWLDARSRVQQRQGDDFDLKAFHRAALDLGSLGLDPLRAALERL
jgi:uncharacterized protein (DUF885 family)